MGLFTYSLTGGGLILIGAWEVFISSYATLHPPLSPPHETAITKSRNPPFFYFIRFLAIAILSFIFIIDSLISLGDALENKDRVGFALQLEIISIASLFSLYSVFGLLSNFTRLVPLPSSILNLIALFAFGQEFLHFYLQRKDPGGLENRYFDLMLAPIAACMFTTVLELGGHISNMPSLARGVGLILQGSWFVQMGFSFYTNAMAQGCSLIEKSRGNFTVMCKGHMASHRSKAMVTLQFNGHLALFVVLIVGVYSFISYKYELPADYMNYKPISGELRQLDNQNQYTLDSDDEIALEENGSMSKDLPLEEASTQPKADSGVNGFGGS